MDSYVLSNVFLSDFNFKIKHWIGSFNIVLGKGNSTFYSSVSFSFNKNWHFNDFTFPLDCSPENRASLKNKFQEFSEPICKSLFHHHILPREQSPHIPNVKDFKLVSSDLENNKFTFSFFLNQHQPIFFLDVFEKNHVFQYKFRSSKKFYDNHITCLYFDYHLFNKLNDLLMDFKEIRFIFSTSVFVHKEKPTINYFK